MRPDAYKNIEDIDAFLTTIDPCIQEMKLNTDYEDLAAFYGLQSDDILNAPKNGE